MAEVNIEQLPKNTVKFTVRIPTDEVRPYLEEAAVRISESSSIPGFRPGKAGYDIVKQRVGEMKIYEEALETIVRKTYVEAILANQIETVGSPKIDVEKLAPGNDIVYTAEVGRMPRVTKLADFRKLKVKSKGVDVGDQDVANTLKDLQRMQTKEVRAVSGGATAQNDKVVVSMNMKKDGVAVEGGSSPNHAIYLAEEYYIPGLKEKIIGMKEGESKTFTLPFPKDHTQKMLAGTNVDFEVSLKEIYHLELPELNDAFATSLGQKDFAGLKELIRNNLKQEKEHEERARQEKEMLELVAKESRFEDLPDLLVNEEIVRMVSELKRGVEEQGLDFEEYLKHLKKTYADLKIDFTPQAIIRLKVALVLREIAKQEKVGVEEKEIDAELDRLAARYEDKEAKKRLYEPDFRDYTETLLQNRKVIDLLRQAMVRS
jgi:trigger factor